MFKLGDTIIWKTQWGSLFLGKIDALFLDKRGVECLHANCVDDVYGPRGFHFIADVSSCKLWLGPASRVIEEKVLPPLVPSKA